MLAIALTFSNDTGAYFAGRALGRHKLYPAVSPAKTVEGAVGGMLAGLLVMLAARALFVPFPFGHALGRAEDPALQHRVLKAALELFSASAGPVLCDFPDDAESGERHPRRNLHCRRDRRGSASRGGAGSAGHRRDDGSAGRRAGYR